MREALLEIVIHACLVANPAHCEYFSVPSFDPQLNEVQCMLFASRDVVTTWRVANPKWRVARWRCRAPGSFAKA